VGFNNPSLHAASVEVKTSSMLRLLSSCALVSQTNWTSRFEWNSNYSSCLNIDKCHFHGFSYNGNGGAISCEIYGATILVERCSFQYCIINGNNKGGAIFMVDCGGAKIVSSCSYYMIAPDRGQFFSIQVLPGCQFHVNYSTVCMCCPNYEGLLHVMRIYGGVQVSCNLNTSRNKLSKYGSGVCFMTTRSVVISQASIINNNGDIALELSNNESCNANMMNFVNNSAYFGSYNYLITGDNMNLYFHYCHFMKNNYTSLFSNRLLTKTSILNQCIYDKTSGIESFSLSSCIFTNLFATQVINHVSMIECFDYWTMRKTQRLTIKKGNTMFIMLLALY